MRIAFVSRGDPCGLNGAGVRMSLTLQALSEIGEVNVYSLVQRPCDQKRLESGILITYVGLIQRRVRLTDHGLALLGFRTRRHAVWRSKDQYALIGADLRSFDLVWAYGERAALAVLAGTTPRALVVDFVDYEGERDLRAKYDGSLPVRLLRKTLARRERKALKRTLHAIERRCNASAISTNLDRTMSGLKHTQVLANSYSISAQPRGTTRGSRVGPARTFLFVGFLEYGPNRDACEWLLSAIWPRLFEALPSSHLLIVGRGADRTLRELLTDGVELLGEVASMDVVLERSDIALVPLRNGSGSRIKVLESWANGIPVVSTQLGVEGLDAQDGLNYLMADDADEFLHQCVRLSTDEDLYHRLSLGGLDEFASTHTPNAFRSHVARMARMAIADMEAVDGAKG